MSGFRTGHDFSKYKRATILRRIARRMQVTRSDSPNAYYDVLRDQSRRGAGATRRPS